MLAALLMLNAHAIPLWVEPELVPLAEEVLRELWPDGPVEVRPAPLIVGETGLWWNGTEIVLLSPEETRVEDASDLSTAILLARTWLRRPPERTLGWIPPVEIELPEGPLVLTQAEPELSHALWVISMGAQGGSGRGQLIDGVLIGAGAMFPHIEFSAAAFITTDNEPELTWIERILDDAAGETASTEFETVTGGLHISYDLGVGRPGRTFVKPRLRAGFETRDSYDRVLTVRPSGPSYNNSESRFDMGPVFAVGADLWLNRIGLRALAGERIGFLPSVNHTNFLSLEVAVWIPAGR